MKLILFNDDGGEVFDWDGERIDFAASIREPGKLRLCFDIIDPDAKSLARATSAAREAAS